MSKYLNSMKEYIRSTSGGNIDNPTEDDMIDAMEAAIKRSETGYID